MNHKIKEFATLISSPKLCESLRYGQYLVKEDGKFCHIFNINFTLAKRLAANYGQQPFAFHKVDNNGIIKQYYEKQNPSQPIRKTNDYVLREESRIEFAIIDFETEPYSTLLSLNEQFADMSDKALTRARESVGWTAIRIRKDVYKGICCQPEALKPLEYYRYECEETFFFSWAISTEERFKHLEHPLWIYFKNGYEDRSNEWLPLVVSKRPYLAFPRKRVKITTDDFEKIVEFVSRYSNESRAVADNEKELTIIDFMQIVGGNLYKKSVAEDAVDLLVAIRDNKE